MGGAMKTVLVIVNNHDFRVSLRSAFESNGFFVFSAANPLEALVLLQKIKTPSLIILSEAMPLMTSDEFLTVKDRDKTMANIPVILLSTNHGCKIVGVQADGRSPINITNVLALAERICSEKRDSDLSVSQIR
jgi:CheY-like chemotaxis protein